MPNKGWYTDIYDLDYFSGNQVSIYIGDVWVDEITSISYHVQQNKAPIYGYASQLFDDTAAGQVLVRGSFSINFKEQGYLWAVLRRYFDIAAASIGATQTKANDKALLATGPGSSRTMPDIRNSDDVRVGSNGNKISRASIERIVRGEASTDEKYRFYHDLAGYVTFGENSKKDKAFEDIVDAFEDEVWQPNATNSNLNSQVRRTDANKFDGFDIYCVYGNMADGKANHTVRKIIGVRLLSESKVVTLEPGVIQENYEFLAQSVA